MEIEVKKARSASVDVEYVELDLTNVLDFLLTEEAPVIEKVYGKPLEEHKHVYPISEKAKLELSKIVTLGKKNLKKIKVRLIYEAWFNASEGKQEEWGSSITYNPDLTMEVATNCRMVRIGRSLDNDPTLFIVSDDGFNANDMKPGPYFLKENQFNYIYTRT